MVIEEIKHVFRQKKKEGEPSAGDWYKSHLCSLVFLEAVRFVFLIGYAVTQAGFQVLCSFPGDFCKSGLFLYSYLPGSVCSLPVSLSIHL